MRVWSASYDLNVSFTSWIAYKDFVYGITWDKKRHYLQCFDPNKGEIRWQKRLEDWAAFLISNDCIILIEAGGSLAIIKATPTSYNELARAVVFNMKDRKNYPSDQCCMVLVKSDNGQCQSCQNSKP